MQTATFDALDYFEKLKGAGFTEEQAKLQAFTLKDVLDERAVTREHLDSRLRETETRFKELDGRIKETELRLQNDIEKAKYSLLKWQIAGWAALAGIMAKGFGWLGF